MKKITLVIFAFLGFVSCAVQKETPLQFKIINKEYLKPKPYYNSLKIHVNFIFFQNNDGTNGFQKDNKEHQEIIAGFKKIINNQYKKLVPLKPEYKNCYSGTDFIEDTKVQFVFKDFYIKNSNLRDYTKTDFVEGSKSVMPLVPNKGWFLGDLDKAINDTISQKGINIYFTENMQSYKNHFIEGAEFKGKKIPVSTFAASQFPTKHDLNRTSQINFLNKFYKYKWMKKHATKVYNKPWSTVKSWFLSEGLGMGHEIAHSLNLTHGNEHHRANQCKPSILNQSNTSRNYLQPTEIVKIHWTLAITNVQQFIDDNQLYGEDFIVNEPLEIKEKQFRFYQNVIVKKNQTLKINNHLILPKKGTLTLEQNARLIVGKNAKITTSNGEKFTQFEFGKNAKIIR